jgi:hypothetical protein
MHELTVACRITAFPSNGKIMFIQQQQKSSQCHSQYQRQYFTTRTMTMTFYITAWCINGSTINPSINPSKEKEHEHESDSPYTM